MQYLPAISLSIQVYRGGKEVSPSAVIVNSRPEPKMIITPGPAAYSPVAPEATSGHTRQPAFSMNRAQSETSRYSDTASTPGGL